MKLGRFDWSTVPRVCAAVLLLWAMGRHPYGYYKLVRWVVCGVGGYMAVEAAKSKKQGWAITFAIIALVFNPFVRVGFDRATWPWVDLAAAVLFAASLVTVRRRD